MKNIIYALLLIFLFSSSNSWAEYTPDSIYTHARSGNLAKVQEKLDQGFDQNMLDNTLAAAVVGDHPELVAFLVEKGADPDQMSSFNTPLLISAIMYGFDQSALALIEAGADLNIRGFRRVEYNLGIEYNWTPLMCSARRGNTKIIQNLLKHGANPAEKGWSNSIDDIESPADIAAYSGHLDAFQLLRNNESPISTATLFKTIRGGHLNTFKELMRNEKDINRIGPARKTLLMEASWWGRTDMVRYLLKHKADPNKVGNNDQTALLEVLSNKELTQVHQLKIIKRLVQKGADIHFKSNANVSALSLAQKYRRTNISRYLQELGAKE